MSIKIINICFLILCILFFSNCSQKYNGEIDGKIVYVNGTNKISYLELKTLKLGIIYTEEEIVAGILNIDKIDNINILYSFYWNKRTTRKMNLKNKITDFFYVGVNPCFIDSSNFFIYEYNKGLLKYSLVHLSLTDTSIVKTRIANYPVNKRFANVVKLPDNSLIFNDPDDYLVIYNPLNKRKKKLEYKDLYPLFYNSNDNLLYCSTHVFRISDSSEELITIDVKKNEKNYLGVYVSENVVFIEPYNSLIYGNPTFSLKYGETTDLYLLNLNTLGESKLISDVGFSDAVYIGNN